ncbi:hypothetical protein HELRODRAFT_159306 [Helobdella robusta]|uniref:Uncharacterized protein n=1 Tax=Helobdella robusta TaxID=6412 RepID=T1ENV4_HELRO|nr:hypothetical protein HELRODRAFT_159306 [Helobdella robusta]ESO12719.1 hypothetical protein HELRODRAFT_159306 [Helobdella robusta]
MEYRGLDGRPITHPPMFRLFTRESMTKIRKRIQEEKQAKDLLKQQEEELGKEDDKNKLLFDEDKPRPNPLLMQGMVLPSKMGEFPPEMCGMPIEDFDEYYHNKYVHLMCRSS